MCHNLHRVLKKSLKPNMDVHNGHAHFLAKLRFISSRSKKYTIFNGGVRVGEKVPSNSMLFLEIIEMTQIFYMALYDTKHGNSKVIVDFNLFIFSLIFYFLEFSQ